MLKQNCLSFYLKWINTHTYAHTCGGWFTFEQWVYICNLNMIYGWKLCIDFVLQTAESETEPNIIL